MKRKSHTPTLGMQTDAHGSGGGGSSGSGSGSRRRSPLTVGAGGGGANASVNTNDDEEDNAHERSRLTVASASSGSGSGIGSGIGGAKRAHASGSHWAASPSGSATAILHPTLADAIELTHPYQEKVADELPGADDSNSPTVRDELPAMVLLVILYCLQGVPLGLCLGSVPFLLQQSVSYTALGYFSLCSWPYSLKLLWSPVVDSWYWEKMGRRKSWIVPIQCVIGFMLIGYSYYVEEWISTGAVFPLTVAFFALILFVATQDIAVDGWAISLLSKRNVSYASTCQSIGQNIGFFASYTVFLALAQPAFCNKFRSAAAQDDLRGFVSLAGYMHFWGVAFLVCTLYLLIMKREEAYVPEPDEDQRIVSLYLRMWRILKLKPVRQLVLVMLTCRLAFSCADNITVLKLLERGFPKENMAMMVVFMFPFDLLMPVLIGRWSARGNALQPFVTGYPFRLFATLLGVTLVYTFPVLSGAAAADSLSLWFYARVLAVQLVYSLASNVLFVSQCSFFAQVCDSSIGGSYMTLLNTISNLGSSWPKFFVFAAVDRLSCKGDLPCSWLPAGTDGFYIVSGISFCIGVAWFAIFRKRLLALGRVDKKLWSCE